MLVEMHFNVHPIIKKQIWSVALDICHSCFYLHNIQSSVHSMYTVKVTNGNDTLRENFCMYSLITFLNTFHI